MIGLCSDPPKPPSNGPGDRVGQHLNQNPPGVTVVRMFMPTCEPAGPLPARVEAGDPGTDSATLGRLSLAGGARSLDARPIARWEIVRLSFPSF